MSKTKARKNPTLIGHLADGDIVIVGEETYRLMIKSFDAWGCRKLLEDGEWSESYTWHKMDVTFTKLVKTADPPTEIRGGAGFDPMMKRG